MKLLSIVIPTVGREDVLQITLASFKEQVKKYSNEVELLVVDNGSSDGTKKLFESTTTCYDWLSYYRYDNQVLYADSIQRAIKHSSGKFVWLYGDDDVAFPTALDAVLNILKKYPDAGLVHTNVIIGKDYGDLRFRKAQLEWPEYESEIEILKIREMLYKRPISMGFITTVIFQRAIWDEGLKHCDPTRKGYAHLFIWFHGIGNLDCIYYPYPIAYGRVPFNKDYLDKWPGYFLIEIPALMQELDKIGITDKLYNEWSNTPDWKSFPKFCNTILMASAFKKKYKPMCKEINKFQSSIIRKLLTYLIVYFAPQSLYGFIRKIIYKQ